MPRGSKNRGNAAVVYVIDALYDAISGISAMMARLSLNGPQVIAAQFEGAGNLATGFAIDIKSPAFRGT